MLTVALKVWLFGRIRFIRLSLSFSTGVQSIVIQPWFIRILLWNVHKNPAKYKHIEQFDIFCDRSYIWEPIEHIHIFAENSISACTCKGDTQIPKVAVVSFPCRRDSSHFIPSICFSGIISSHYIFLYLRLSKKLIYHIRTRLISQCSTYLIVKTTRLGISASYLWLQWLFRRKLAWL